MPKEVKVKPSLKKKERLDPLHVQILREEHHGKNVEIVGNRPSRKTRKNSKHHCDNSHSDDNDDVMENEEVADDISPAMTRKILLQAQEQQRELELEMNMTDSVVVKDEKVQFDSDSDDDDEDQEDQEEEDFDQQDFPLEHADDAEDDDANDYETFNPDENFDDNNEVELALFDKFRAGQTNIHSSLVEKLEFLRSSGGGNNGNDSNSKSLQALCASMPAKVVEAYGKVGLLLSRYKSGKLPKAFKIIPSLRNWEDVLALTQPEKWTAHAVYEATKIFVSNLNARMAQRFFHLVLLDRVRSEIAETRRLSYHLFAALKKSLYKPAAFFKGILLPLCEAGDCTLREATILAGVLVRVSIPVLHSSAALLKLAEMPYSGGNSIFIRALLDKKYALPYRVVDALVFHFLSFEHNPLADRYPLPVLWHQALLTLVQRYKHDLTLEQKECLCRLTLRRSHHQISGEIQRELMQSSVRQASSGSDKMDLVEGENPSTKTSQDHLKAFLEQEKQKMML